MCTEEQKQNRKSIEFLSVFFFLMWFKWENKEKHIKKAAVCHHSQTFRHQQNVNQAGFQQLDLIYCNFVANCSIVNFAATFKFAMIFQRNSIEREMVSFLMAKNSLSEYFFSTSAKLNS